MTIYDDEGNEFLYQVESNERFRELGESLEVRQKNASWISPTDDERITLITCWPYTSNSHRVIVVAKPVSPEQAASN